VVIKTVYDSYEGEHFGNLEANLRFLASTAVLRGSGRVLEIGSGRGGMLEQLRLQGARAVGIEPNRTLVAEAQALHPGIPLAQMSGTALGFPDSTFEVVVSFDVFEHIADSDTHLREVRRVLVPGGCFAFQTPNKWTNVIFETIRWRSFTAWKQDHCALHSLRQLERRLVRHGFDPVFEDVPVVNAFFEQKLRRYLGPAGPVLLRVANPDRWPLKLRTNLFVVARRRG
jgi:SAM-dependent methyltransferase